MVYLGIFIFVVCLIAFFRKKDTKAREDAQDAFWERETRANHIRRQDISGLPYLTIPLDRLPIGTFDHPDLIACEDTLKALSSEKILNLSNQTNTDLKLAYGLANLEALSGYDQNFATLCRTLVSYAECLLKLEHPAEAQTVLEYGISCGSDHSQNYRLLADLYRSQNASDRLSELRKHAEDLDSPMKNTILKYIGE